MPKSKPTLDQWEKEFEDLLNEDIKTNDPVIPKIKSFIRQTINSYLDRVEREVLSDHHKLVKLFHNEYEGAAEKYGWKTNKKTRVEFENLPPENLQLMLGTCKLVLWHLRSTLQAIREEVKQREV